MTQSLSSLVISSIKAVVSTTATFLAGGRVGEQAGSGGEVAKVGQEGAIWPFC